VETAPNATVEGTSETPASTTREFEALERRIRDLEARLAEKEGK
jgi:BMFP domain-containing protein YqiC